ncbi:MAG: helix-turn-helix transcriptional regulator [Evtepia sp.]|uniref:helix-turn-helix transcriptional regulator n=1 Tax=Evtepia sp. TaxID=2773933 RepID=UPI002A75CA4A|nr:helix-turn-helix transcriptional regulator [Evtepia sp.]MDY3013911.1 helix-turn-helix transcriptional regulator [Evtepia sp.]
MLIFDNRVVGNKLLTIRKRLGLTQTQVAEAAELSDRAYADIERGTVNMRMDTILRICRALRITPDEILTECPDQPSPSQKNSPRSSVGSAGGAGAYVFQVSSG